MSMPHTVRTTRSTQKSLLLATVAAVAAGSPGLAHAEDAESAPEGKASDIVVTGFRGSLEASRNLKKQSVIQIDAIVAEDMAKFPELNLAESLQRLPGVQITREAGEGRRISLRGLGPDFARVQLNGMEVLGNVDSAQDSRGQRSRDRAFDFNIFASELFSRVEVEKTFQAAQKEGGMAGTVGLFTGKPFDYEEGLHGTVRAKIGSNSYTKDVQNRLVGLLTYNHEGTFGAAISVAYGKRETSEQGHNNYNYSYLGKTTVVNGVQQGDAIDLVAGGLDISHLSASKRARFLAGDLYFADGNRISSWNAKLERLGITGSVQWRPSPTLLLTLDGLYSQFTTHRDELHLATRPLNGFGSTVLDGPKGSPWPAIFNSPTVLNDFTVDANNYVTRTDVSNTTFGSEHRRELNKNKFNQLAFNFKWEPSDRLAIDGLIGYEKSKYDTPIDDKLYMRAKGNQVVDWGADGRSATFTYPGTNLTNPAIYAMDNFYYRAFWNSSELRQGGLNLRYKLDDQLTLRAGAAYHRFAQDGASYFYDGGANGTTAKTRGTSVADITDVFSNSFGTWLIGNYDRAFAKYNEYHRLTPNTKDGAGGALQDIENVYATSEESITGYLQVDWDSEIFGARFRGNVGLRAYHTKTHSQGWIQGDSYAYLGTADVRGSYSGVLPTLNTVLELTPDNLIRFAATQNLNRPGLDAMAAKGTAFLDSNVACDFTKPASKTNCYISVSRGNPNLKPYKDVTLDLSLEHYFGRVGLISAAVFHKWITNFIDTVPQHNITFSQAGVPAATIPGASANTIVTDFSMPQNIAGTKTLTGVELAAQSQFSFLPAPFDKFGVVANFTYVDADAALTGISPVSYNGTLYYETDRWSIRGSLSHRNTWFTGRSSDPMSADTRGFTGGTYVDASASFNITKAIQLTFDAINLTNTKDTQFWGQPQYLYNQNQSGTTYMAGVSAKF